MNDDTQRELEQRALRNVRGLVDSLDTADKIDHRTQKKLFAWIVVGALAGIAVLASAIVYVANRPAAKTIVIEDRAPPAAPAGAKK